MGFGLVLLIGWLLLVPTVGLSSSSSSSTIRPARDTEGRQAPLASNAPGGQSPGEERRPLAPPFPNGRCGGSVVTIPQEETFGSQNGGDLMLLPRPIQVWLPPDYRPDQGTRHPVLYTHDGQNAMEDTASWTGSCWRLTGALTRMADHGYFQDNNSTKLERRMPIVVMIPSAEGDLLPGVRRRHLEYGDSSLPFAQAHADFVAQTVKPLIDARFATQKEAEFNFAIGSSLGGQASLHLLLRYPHLFGGAACLSPFFGPSLLDEVGRSGEALQSKKIYLDIGGDLNDVSVPLVDVLDHLTPEHWWNPGYFWLDTQLQESVTAMKRSLDRAQVPYRFEEFPGGRHNERAWAQRIHQPLLHLFE